MKFLLQVVFLFLASVSGIRAQNRAADSSYVYTYVEQMPELPSGGGISAVSAVIHRYVMLPRIEFVKEVPVLRAVISFVIDSAGIVRGERVEQKSEVEGYDYAVLESVRKLPRMKPGRHNGKAVPVRLTIPVRICMQ